MDWREKVFPWLVIATYLGLAVLVLIRAPSSTRWLVLAVAFLSISSLMAWLGALRARRYPEGTLPDDSGRTRSLWAWVNGVFQWSPVLVVPLLLLLGYSFWESLYWAVVIFTIGLWSWLLFRIAAVWIGKRNAQG